MSPAPNPCGNGGAAAPHANSAAAAHHGQAPSEPWPEPPHSGLGLAAFITSALATLAMLLCLAMAGFMEASGVEEQEIEWLIELLALGLGCLMFAQVVAAGLGIAALTERHSKRLFGVLGTALSILSLLVCLLLMAVGGAFTD